MKRLKPPPGDMAGWCAVILAIGLSVGWCASIVISATPWTDQISAEGASLLNGLGQVLAGALATYLGAHVAIDRRRRRREEDEDEDEEP